jgi:hypothetical protein
MVEHASEGKVRERLSTGSPYGLVDGNKDFRVVGAVQLGRPPADPLVLPQDRQQPFANEVAGSTAVPACRDLTQICDWNHLVGRSPEQPIRAANLDPLTKRRGCSEPLPALRCFKRAEGSRIDDWLKLRQGQRVIVEAHQLRPTPHGYRVRPTPG